MTIDVPLIAKGVVEIVGTVVVCWALTIFVCNTLAGIYNRLRLTFCHGIIPLTVYNFGPMFFDLSWISYHTEVKPNVQLVSELVQAGWSVRVGKKWAYAFSMPAWMSRIRMAKENSAIK
jgi:hypothetical protein